MSQVEMDLNVLEKDSRALSGLFQAIVNDMKGSTIIWEDFNSKATKLHTSLRSTIVVISSFLDAFQKVADLANCSRGATRDIGASLTRLCLRHRSIETKLRAFASAITGTVVEPLQMRLEEWKKTAVQLDKDHAKEYKKMQQEIKKASSDTIRLQKRTTKKGQGDLRHRLENAFQDVHAKYNSMEEMEKRAVRSAMIEERSRFCSYISFLSPLMEHEISMLTEVTHLQEIVELLAAQTADPTSLPQSCEQVILDLKGSDGSQKWTSTPPGSPLSLGSHLGSHRSSACSIASSSSSSLQSSQGLQQLAPLSQPLTTPFAPMPSSTLSHDSGYASQDLVPVDFRRELSLEVGDQTKLNSIPVNTEDELIDDGSSPMSDLPPHTVAGTTVSLSRPYSPNHFHPSASTPAFTDPSACLERSHTISYPREHSHARPALTALSFEPLSNAKSQNASNQSLPSNISSNYAVPSNVVTMRLPKMTEDGEMVADIYARPLQGQRRSGVVPCPVAPPTVPDKFYAPQMQQSNTDAPESIYTNASTLNSQGNPEMTNSNDGITDERNSVLSPHQSLLRSFSFPVQSTVFPTSGQNEACDTPMAGPPDTISEKGCVLTSENVTEFDESGKASTLPRMPQFKEPLMPQRYSTTLSRPSGNVGPPTLPKRSSSRLSVKPPPPVRCNSAKSASMERIAPVPAAAPVISHPSRFRHSMDTSSVVTTEIITLSRPSDGRVLSASDVRSSGSGVHTDPGTSQDNENASSKFNTAEGSMPQLRQQAPPSDDSDQLRPLLVQPEMVIPLFEEVLECSFTQMHSPIHDSIAPSVTTLSLETPGERDLGVSTGEDMLEVIKRGVTLRRTITNDRSAPRIAD